MKKIAGFRNDWFSKQDTNHYFDIGAEGISQWSIPSQMTAHASFDEIVKGDPPNNARLVLPVKVPHSANGAGSVASSQNSVGFGVEELVVVVFSLVGVDFVLLLFVDVLCETECDVEVLVGRLVAEKVVALLILRLVEVFVKKVEECGTTIVFFTND